MSQKNIFTRFSSGVSHAAGKPLAFGTALLGVVVWAVSGPFFGFSETWQLVVNTSTTIVTFLMVFVLQNTQNRDSEALHAKLDDLILTSKTARNDFIGAERLSEHEIKQLHQDVERAANGAPDDNNQPESDLRTTVSPAP
ncbi:putative small integral membrane protein [Devosia sp. LC5]|uniref:low affinity iron permease family protein n=1 Tax=Devosia sp. LC5 TaxID=1502724 RepID=UPI0004E3CCF9|nr:low affinity iron permease family protein [Devosia sp. LC5]KFC66672.1 putative small integral membrane protein [Devosia sp. LC5]